MWNITNEKQDKEKQYLEFCKKLLSEENRITLHQLSQLIETSWQNTLVEYRRYPKIIKHHLPRVPEHQPQRPGIISLSPLDPILPYRSILDHPIVSRYQ